MPPPPSWGDAQGGAGTAVPGATPGVAPVRYTYATFGQRAAALLLDMVLSLAAHVVLVAAAVAVGLLFALVHNVLGVAMGLLLALVGYALMFVVTLLTEAGPYGQTPGKHLMGIRVLDTSGRTLSQGMSAARYGAKMISGLPCYGGYLMPLWDPDHRALHDLLVKTRVVVATDRAPSLVAIVAAPFRGWRRA